MSQFWDRYFNRTAVTVALVVIYLQESTRESPIAIAGASLVILLYLVLVWSRDTWWTTAKYVAICCVMLAVVFSLHEFAHVHNSLLLWPLIGVLAMVQGTYSRLAIVLAGLTMLAILVMSYTYPFPVETLLALIGLFAAVRGRRIRRAAYRMTQLHLEELNHAHAALQQAHAELQEATVHSMRFAAMEERTRLAREIHDGIGHQLTSLIVQLQALQIMIQNHPKEAGDTVAQLLGIARRAMAEVRLAVREWSDDETGLGLVALRGLVSQTQARSDIQCNFLEETDLSEWPMQVSVALYRVLQESLTNILRHANATEVTVRILEEHEQVVLRVCDNGQYSEETPLVPGFGLQGMMGRCNALGGTCTFSPVKPHGLCIEVTLPIRVVSGDDRSTSEGKRVQGQEVTL